jgi:hypothetical protein
MCDFTEKLMAGLIRSFQITMPPLWSGTFRVAQNAATGWRRIAG